MTGALDAQTQKERCGRCGKMSPVRAAFCPRCGVRLRDVSPVLQAEVLDAEPMPDRWEVLEPPTNRPIPVIRVPPPLPRAAAAPVWSGPRPMMTPGWSARRPTTPLTYGRAPQQTKKRPWLFIVLGVFVLRAFAAFGTHSSFSSSPSPTYIPPSPPVRSAPVYAPYHPPAVTSPRSHR